MSRNWEILASGELLILLVSDVEDLALKRDGDVPEVGRHLEIKDAISPILKPKVLEVLSDGNRVDVACGR